MKLLEQNVGKKTEMVGLTFDRLTVLSEVRVTPSRTRIWLCQCTCGNTTEVEGGNLRSGQIKSCGCLRKESASMRKNNLTHGMSDTSEYQTWINIRRRCNDPEHHAYPDYGGRGISVSERWNSSFEAFYADMGPKPSPEHTIDRERNNGNYEPGNCRWATMEEQQNNRRNNNVIVVGDKEYSSVARLARDKGISEATLKARLYGQDMCPDEAVNKPTDRRLNEVDGRKISVREISSLTGISSSTVQYKLKKGMTVADILADKS